MERHLHTMSNLFAQLGRANDAASIARFFATSPPLPSGAQLHEAPCWTPAQAAFLREAVLDDADWAEVVEALNSELHAKR